MFELGVVIDNKSLLQCILDDVSCLPLDVTTGKVETWCTQRVVLLDALLARPYEEIFPPTIVPLFSDLSATHLTIRLSIHLPGPAKARQGVNACTEVIESPLESVRNKYTGRAMSTQESISRLEEALINGITAQVSFKLSRLHVGPCARAVSRERQ